MPFRAAAAAVEPGCGASGAPDPPDREAALRSCDDFTMSRASLSTLTRHIPRGQLGRYLAVGLWNTAFGYGTFALFTALLDRYVPASYLAASLVSSVLNITVSFLGYKWFVFRTAGNYLREWARCLMVYSGSIALGLVLLPPTVFLVAYLTGSPGAAPYIAGALVMGVQVVVSFVGHRRFSFGVGREPTPRADE
jgi:putative flippase GtrA